MIVREMDFITINKTILENRMVRPALELNLDMHSSAT